MHKWAQPKLKTESTIIFVVGGYGIICNPCICAMIPAVALDIKFPSKEAVKPGNTLSSNHLDRTTGGNLADKYHRRVAK